METIIIQAETRKKKAIIEILKAFDIPFAIKKEEKKYNIEFVAKIKSSEEQYKKGQFTRVKAEDLNQFIDNL